VIVIGDSSSMPINSKEILSVVSQLTANRHVRVTVTSSFKSVCIVAITTGIGELLLGEAGLVVGGIVGGGAAYLMTKDKFKSIPEVIMHDMTHAQREQLVASVAAVIADLRLEDTVLLVPMLLNSPGAKEAVLRSVFAFIENEMRLQIVD